VIALQIIVSGFLLGAVYALFSSGLTLIWGMMNVVNFAHGDFVMLGMYAAFMVWTLTGGGPAGSTDLVAHRIYAEAFGSAAIGRASVMAVVLFVILIGVTVVQHLYFRRRISYDLV